MNSTKVCKTYAVAAHKVNYKRQLLAHIRLSDLIESYYSNLTVQVETDSH